MVKSVVLEYIVEEVSRQGHDVAQQEGLVRVAWMIDAWLYAMAWKKSPTITQVIGIGQMMERTKNYGGIRKEDVFVGDRQCPDPKSLRTRLRKLLAFPLPTPLDNYRAFEEIHPFIDGNGRTGKILLNFWNGTLHDPIFPPNDFWGRPIRNP